MALLSMFRPNGFWEYWISFSFIWFFCIFNGYLLFTRISFWFKELSVHQFANSSWKSECWHVIVLFKVLSQFFILSTNPKANKIKLSLPVDKHINYITNDTCQAKYIYFYAIILLYFWQWLCWVEHSWEHSSWQEEE